MHIPNEHYHVYNRGAHKAPIFHDTNDYHRFLCLLYIANNSESVRLCNLNIHKIFTYERKATLVDIVAYCLMPNHFHIALREKVDGGITRFIQKLCTGYSMYYNIKYDHSGTIFQGQFKAKHVDNDDYFRYLIQYIHLNPFGIQEPDMMRDTKNEHIDDAIAYSKTYEYSSFKDYLGESRPQASILATTSKGRPR